MEFRNFTPFPALAYQALDQKGASYHVVTMRQTLEIQLDGSLKYTDEQEPLAVADEYFGEMNRSSVREESDLAPFKPKCDVILVATAYAPHGKPASRFLVSLRIREALEVGASSTVGKLLLEKTLTVTGPRFWERNPALRTWHLTEPEPITSLPLRYEDAYGGELKLNDTEGQQRAIATGQDPKSLRPLRHTVVETNPVGRGYAEDWFIKANKLDRIRAPQIEDPANPILKFGTPYPAQGFGVITKAWLPRRKLCGTADEAFAKSDKWLPTDFDFAFWNGAHPDLQIPYLKGDETIELTHLTPDGKLRLQLPGHRPYILIRYEEGEIQPAPINLDTLFIDTAAKKVSLVHRLIVPVEPEIRVFEARLINKKEWDAAVASIAAAPQNRSELALA